MRAVLLYCLFLLCTAAVAQNRFSEDLLLKVIYQHQYDRNTASLLNFLELPDARHREAACLAFASIQDTSAIPVLFKRYLEDKHPAVRRAAVYSLGQLRLPTVSARLIPTYALKSNADIRDEVLIAIGKGAGRAEIPFFAKLRIREKDTLLQYAYTYAVFQAYRRYKDLMQDGGEGVYSRLKHFSLINQNPALQTMASAILKTGSALRPHPMHDRMPKMRPHYSLGSANLDSFAKRMGGYYRLTEDIANLQLDSVALLKIAFDEQVPHVFRNACMEQFLRSYPYAPLVQRMLYSRNLSFVSLACGEILKDSATIKRRDADLLKHLNACRKTLDMPRDFEAWVETEKAICALEGRKYVYRSWFDYGYRFAPDWEHIKNIPATQKVKITSSKGSIVLLCRVNEAPVSVSNFLKLVDSGYYNGKYFHRMVPGFVVQGGCPRGDGWGALDWTQRSEFSNYLRYRPGSAGLASAGKDSEGVQFFIAHTWTPHLDGRYSIFAEVTEGMDVVLSLVVGDMILSIERL